MSTCNICCEKITARRRNAPCMHCGYEACITCWEQYFLSLDDMPKCMKCGVSILYIDVNALCRKTFVNKELREHLTNIYFKWETTYFKDTELYMHKKKYISLEDYSSPMIRYYDDLIVNIDKGNASLKTINVDFNIDYYMRATAKTFEKISKKVTNVESFKLEVFKTTACFDINCAGALISGACNKCGVTFCIDCREVGSSSHKCNPEILANLADIKDNSRPCPVCQLNIFKAEGCNDMLCTKCGAKFNYNTGMIINNAFENPHEELPIQEREFYNITRYHPVFQYSLIDLVDFYNKFYNIYRACFDIKHIDTFNLNNRVHFLENKLPIDEFRRQTFLRYKFYWSRKWFQKISSQLIVDIAEIIDFINMDASHSVIKNKINEHLKYVHSIAVADYSDLLLNDYQALLSRLKL